MIGTPLSTFTFQVYRRTDRILDTQPVVASWDLAGSKCPKHGAFVQATLVGGTLSGSLRVLGTYQGAPVNELLTFSGPTGDTGQVTKVGCQRFDCITEVTSTGLANEVPVPTVLLTWVGSGGEPVHVNCLLNDCIIGHREYRGAGSWPARKPGATQTGKAWIAFDDLYDYRPRPDDVFVEVLDDGSLGERWLVVGKPRPLGNLQRSHWEIDVDEVNTTDIELRTS